MTRLTKSEIERTLLAGEPVKWQDAHGKECGLALETPEQRRLFAYLLGSKVREPKGLPADFIAGLSLSYDAQDTAPQRASPDAASKMASGPWRLQSIETEGFGGINIWGGTAFHYDFDQESLLLEGPNGSGKSSLLGAVIWP